MAKKLFLLMSIAATIAFAVPTMASASPGLTMPGSSLIPAGTLVSATSSNFTFTKNGVARTCSTNVELRGKVIANSPTSGVQVGSSGVTTTAVCNWPAQNLTYEGIVLSELTIKESGKGTATFSMKLPVGSAICNWTAKSVPFTYAAGSSSIKFKAVTLTPTPIMACAFVEVDADFTLETTAPSSGLVVID